MVRVNATPLRYKSYTGVIYTSHAPNGEPGSITVKVYATKKPKADVIIGTGWFSESRGYGGESGSTATITNPDAIALCRAAIATPDAIPGLIDKMIEMGANGEILPKLVPGNEWKRKAYTDKLSRFWTLANVDNPSAFVDNERRERAFADKKFNVGDRVVYCSRHTGRRSEEANITAEHFDRFLLMSLVTKPGVRPKTRFATRTRTEIDHVSRN